jgi:hypothetical protein
MGVFTIGIEHALDVAIQCSHDTDARVPRKARQVLANHKRKPSVLVFE